MNKTRAIFIKNTYEKNPKKCIFCNKIIPYEKRVNIFCDSSCAASYNNKGNTDRRTHGLYRAKDCIHCGKLTTNSKFCSQTCLSDHNWKITCEKIESNGALLPTKDINYGYTPTIARRYLKEKRGDRCSICFLEEWTGQPIPLVLDHINGNPFDHSLENIRLVCGNCNMTLPTYTGRNFGKGRKLGQFNLGL